MKKILALLILTISILGLTACSIRQENETKVVTLWTLQMGEFSGYMYKVIRNY